MANKTMEEINALNDIGKKTITIGITGAKTLLFTSRVVEHIQSAFSDYRVRYVQDEMTNLCAQVKARQITCALGAINFQTGVESVRLSSQPLALYVSRFCGGYESLDSDEEMNINSFPKMRFILLHAGTVHRQLVDRYFTEYGYTPVIFAESRDYETIYNTVNTSPVATIASVSHHGNMPDAHMIRLIHPAVLLPSTTALATIDPGGREKGLLSGANVVMPNLSPVDVRDKYTLYENKICTGEESAQCRSCLEMRVKAAGYEVVTDRGDVKR